MNTQPTSAQPTRWRVHAPAAYDALCLMNIWTGQPFYTSQHPGVYERWTPRLSPPVRAAFERLDGAVRLREQRIVSAWLCLLFSAGSPDSVEDLLRLVRQPEEMFSAFVASGYGEPETVGLARELLPDLDTLLSFLQDSPFEEERRADLGEQIVHRQAELQAALERFDVVGAVERELGQPVASGDIEVLTLAYTAPHGMRLTGRRFVTSPSWPPEITVRTAIHELMHPPFDLQSPELQAAFKELAQLTTLRAAFEAHDPAFGYNSWAGYVEENCVRALDQVISEGFGIARDAQERWAREDGGMHLLAARLTPLLRERRGQQPPFGTWFVEQVRRGAFGSA